MTTTSVRVVAPSGDTTGATDPDNIAAMVSSLQADYSGSNEVTIVLVGDYYFDEPVAITGTPGVAIAGVNATVTQKTAATYSFTFASGASYGGCTGIQFIADTEMDDAVSVDGCTDLVFENVHFTNYRRHGVVFSGTCTRSRFDIRKQDAEWAVELLKELTAETRNTYTRTVYSYNSTAITAGASHYQLLGPFFWFNKPGDYDYTRVDPETVAEGIVGETSRGATTRVLADIEHWGGQQGDLLKEQDQGLRNIRNGLWAWRAGSGRELGIYETLPYSDYWTPALLQRAIIDGNPSYSEATQTAKIARNMELNDRTADALVDLVDYLCPRCYRSYNSDTYYPEWQWYVTLSVMEALRISRGKPVYPIVSFRAWGENPDEELTEARWIQSLQYVAALPGISGIMVYSGGTAPSGYVWTDAIDALINSNEPFEDS